MFLRGDFWHYDFIVGGVRYRGSTGHKKNEKEKAKEAENRLRVQARDGHSIEMIWEQTKRKLISGKEISLNFDVIWELFCNNGYSNACSRRFKLYSAHLKNFCSWMKEKYPNVKKISEVLPIHAQEWMQYLYKSRGSNSTKNDYLASLRMIFRSLGRDYGIIENPFDSVRKIPSNKIAREAFTPEELKLIGEKATGWIYSLCLTAVSTGLREGDICLLKKSSINLATGWISIPHTRKTGVSVEIPILPGLKQHLQEVMEDDSSEFVYPVLANMYVNNPSRISAGIKSFFEKIGIAGTTKKIDGYKKILSVKDVHSFRHTFVYMAACHGIPFPIVQGIVGHTSPEMTKHYMNHAGREAKTEYLSRLPDYLTAGRSPLMIEEKRAQKKELSPERILRLMQYITVENLERNKARIQKIINRNML